MKYFPVGKTNKTHGMTETRTYRLWSKMKSRCFCKKNNRYSIYGGRGITVCERWLKFENFFADMGKCPIGLTLDRLDNEKNYGPGNCRWADIITQQNNKRNNRILNFKGIKKTLMQWSRTTGITRSAINHRLARGWDIDRALSQSMR